MTAAVSAGRSNAGHGLRPFDPRRDLAALADLIEIGFAENLDRSGQRLVRGLRLLGRLGWVGGVLSRWLLPPAANPQGYVWEEDGIVHGNASLLPVSGTSHRWVMANVVVRPAQRRRGIGRMLVTKSIEYARQRGAGEIVLQVDQENDGATSLYNSLGFQSSKARTTWRGHLGTMNLGSTHHPRVRRRRKSEWQQQWQLARELFPEGLVWPYPPSANTFRPAALRSRLGLTFDRHWVWVQGDHIGGSVSMRWGLETGFLRLILLTDAEHQGRIEAELLRVGLGEVRAYGDTVEIDYPCEVAEQAFRNLGFQAKRHLIWMIRKL